MSEQSETPSLGGRPRKAGQWVRFNTTALKPLVELLKQEAAAQGIPVSDLLSEILAARYSRQDVVREAMPKAG